MVLKTDDSTEDLGAAFGISEERGMELGKMAFDFTQKMFLYNQRYTQTMTNIAGKCDSLEELVFSIFQFAVNIGANQQRARGDIGMGEGDELLGAFEIKQFKK